MSLVLIRKTAPVQGWLDALAERCPTVPVHVWPETGPVDEVEFVLTWAADPGVIASFPNLRAIFSLGAGVDHIIDDATVPTHIPVARMIDPSLTQAMVQFVVMTVLAKIRHLPQLLSQSEQGIWARPQTLGLRVGVMGLGELGTACAQALAGLGVKTSGWSRSAKQLPGVQCFSGAQGKDAFLAQSDVLVCLLPRTHELDGILDIASFRQLPPGAYLINVGRGEHVVDADLIDALDQGLLSGALLDVFRQEPLPAEHAFWAHPGIVVTPHLASATVPATAVEHVAENIRRARAAEDLAGLVARNLGY